MNYNATSTLLKPTSVQSITSYPTPPDLSNATLDLSLHLSPIDTLQMYAQPGQQQSPQQPLHPQHGQPQYRNGDGQPMNASYPPPPPGSQPAPGQMNPNRPEMITVPPHYQQPYHQPHEMPRLPAPSNFYQPSPQNYQPQQPQQNVNMNQSAPRQRTAIACKYCRRRKIRCSGFENSEDGRCTNCVRFSQECVFTPVSAQTQAFVPAQAVYGPRARGPPGAPPQLYGSYGQPLPRQPDGYPHPQHYAMPSPTYPPPGQQGYGPPGYPPQQQYEQPQSGGGRRRTRDEPHTPTLPPPNPAATSHLAGHMGQEQPAYAYPEPTAFTNGAISPNSSASYPPHQPQPYYAPQPQPQRRASPGSTYSYEQPRGSSSPHAQAGYSYGQSALQSHQSQAPAQSSGRTPPPHSGASDNGSNGNRLAIRDIVDGNGQGERTAADSNMVSALNRPPRRS